MRRALWFILKLAVAVAVLGWLVDRPGRVTFIWRGSQIDTSMPVVLGIVAALVVLGAQLYRAWGAMKRAPREFKMFRDRRRRERGYQALTQGMVAVAAGDAAGARRFAARADQLLGDPPLTMLLSAQAAQLGGDEDAAAKYFQAMLNRPETAFLGARGLLTQALRQGRDGEALSLAHHADALQPHTPWVLNTLVDLEARARRWQEADGALTQAVHVGALSRAIGDQRRTVLLIEQSAAAERQGEMDLAISAARKAFKLTPGFAPAAVTLARLAMGHNHQRVAIKVLERAWTLAPHPELAAAYLGLNADSAPLVLVKQAQRLLELAPERPEGRLALAGAALQAGLWGEARRQLEALLNQAPSPQVYRLRARLEDAEHGDSVAAREWERRAAFAPHGPAWVCSSCGTTHEHWSGLCPQCSGFDTLSWRLPPPAHTEAAEITSPSTRRLLPADGGLGHALPLAVSPPAG